MGDNQGTKVKKLRAARSQFMNRPLIRIGLGKGHTANNSQWNSVTKRKRKDSTPEDSTPESFNYPRGGDGGREGGAGEGNGGGHLFWPVQSSCFYKTTFFLSLPVSWTFSM